MITRQSSTNRLDALDGLRAFALYGILYANWANTGPLFSREVDLLVTGSFYPIFAWLFGYGIGSKLAAPPAGTRRKLGRLSRRAAALYLIGLLHYVAFWRFDVLRLYAILTIPCAALSFLPRRWLVGVIAGLLVASAWPFRSEPAADNTLEIRRFELEVLRRQAEQGQQPVLAGMRAALQLNLLEIRAYAQPANMKQIFWVMALFLAGVLSWQIGIAANLVRTPRITLTAASTASVVAVLILQVERTQLSGGATWEDVLRSVSDLVLSIAYTLVFLSACFAQRFKQRLLPALAAAGQMSLTNYVVQSIALTTLFYGRGFGMRINGWQLLVVLNAFFVGQVVFSYAWLSQFGTGPLEWLVRSAVAGRPQHIHKPPYQSREEVAPLTRRRAKPGT
jgi:uncharacterized protein